MDFVEPDICTQILQKYSNSNQESHKHICTTIATMSQELKDQNLPLTPLSYFLTTLDSLKSLTTDPSPPAHIVESLLTILSSLVPCVPNSVFRKMSENVNDVLFKVLRSKSVTPNAASSAIKCVSGIILVQEKVTWGGALAEIYGFLLTCATDPSPKVRKQSQMCLRDVLSSFQRTPVLAPASEAFTKIFERLLLLAGGSDPSASDSPKGGAQEVLYLLDALTDCLPLLSPKFANAVLKYFKSLLALRQPVVTKRITSCLNSVCQYPTLEVSPEVLLDLLCLLSVLISANEMSADDMTFNARLLDLGIKKVYSANQQLCAAKLPLVFNALADMLASEHEAALFAATEALKSLIHACVDESLTQQGISQIRERAHETVRKSGPTVVEKLCATVEKLLDYSYSAVWDMSFQVVSALFGNLGVYSSYVMKGTLKSLGDMQKLPDEDFPFRKQLHVCIGSALATMGPETFLSILPLKLESKDLSEANDWLFPILKQYTVGARLSFFTESILSMIRSVRQRSLMLEREGKMHSSRSVAGLIYSLWSLLPSCCNYPLDTSESFKELEKELLHALREEPDARGIICSALQILIEQNKKIVEGNVDLPGTEVSISIRQAVARYTPQVATDNLSILKSSARQFLPVLSTLFVQSSKDAGGCLQATISQFASIADKKVVAIFFKTRMEDLLLAIQEAAKAESSKSTSEMQIDNSSNDNSVSLRRAQLLDLAVTLLPGLGSKQIDLLFVVIGPALKDADGLFQKKAYKGLSYILKNSDVFLSKNIGDLLDMMIDVLPSCHVSAKRHRLDCLYFLIVYISKGELELARRRDAVASFLTEIILSLKEANKKTRNRAYDMIVEIGHACGDEERGGKKENLHQFFSMVAGGLAGESPHMISAAVTGLARLAYEFSDLVSAAYDVLPSTFLLLRRKNKEILKASLGLLKVLVAKSQSEGLQIHLRSIVEGLLMWQDGTKNHFKAKVKYLLEMLVKKCGLDAVKSVMPEDHMKLLTNIRKIKERREKGTSVVSEDAKSRQSKATTSRLSKWNHTKIFSEFGDEEEDSVAEYMDGQTISGRRSKTSGFMTNKSSFRSKRSREVSKSLPEDSYDQSEDEPLDLLDRQRTRSSLRSSSQHLGRKSECDDEPEIDPEGRLIIHEDGERKREREKSHDNESDGKSQAGSNLSMNSQRDRKRKKTSESGGWAYTGNEYASKKASGDVKRKGKLEPYAYWPLDRKMMSRRPEQRAAARKGMSSVIKMAKGLEGRSVSSALSLKAMKIKKGNKRILKKNLPKKENLEEKDA